MPCNPQRPGAASQTAARGLPNVSSSPAATKSREIFRAACVALHPPHRMPCPPQASGTKQPRPAAGFSAWQGQGQVEANHLVPPPRRPSPQEQLVRASGTRGRVPSPEGCPGWSILEGRAGLNLGNRAGHGAGSPQGAVLATWLHPRKTSPSGQRGAERTRIGTLGCCWHVPVTLHSSPPPAPSARCPRLLSHHTGGHPARSTQPGSGDLDAPCPAALSHYGGISPQSPSIRSQGTWLSAQQRACCLPCRPPAGARRLVYRAYRRSCPGCFLSLLIAFTLPG